MRSLSIVALLVLAFCAPAVFSQGGKAEPRRIEFAKGRSSVTVSGTLSNGQEMDHVFKARAGQSVKLGVTSNPRGNLFEFRIKGDGFEVETDYDSYTEYSFIAPETGDYLVFVRKRPTQTAARAKFFLKLTVK
jgi:hypothetical protein